MSTQTKIQRLNKRLNALNTERSYFLTEWKSLASFINPRAARFTQSDVNKGKVDTSEILDSAATVALRTLGSGMMAGLTSPARQWFTLTTADAKMMQSAGVKEWLYEVEQLIRAVFAKSNLYNILPLAYTSLGLFGTQAFSVMEDVDDVIRCYPFPIGTYSLAQDARQRINTIYREMRMTVSQLVKEFGLENCSEAVKAAYQNNNDDQWVDIVHVIEPRQEYDPSKVDSRNMPFASIWYEKAGQGDQYLRESGFNSFPVMAGRWEVNGEDIYGSSPGMYALPDVKQLQKMAKRSLQAIDKMVNPPMLADATMRTTRTSQLPGDVTFIAGLANSSAAGFRPAYEVNPRIQELEGKMQECRNRISRIFFEDMMSMFAMSDTTQMTAREVEERHQEKLLILGPVMERLNDEILSPLINRTFELMSGRGMIPPAPQSIQDTPLQIEYVSIMAQAQKMIGTSGIERLAGFAGNLAGANPAVLDKIDFDHMVDEYANMLGVSPKVVNSDDTVMSIRTARQQQEQASRLAQMAQPAQQAADAAKLLSETDVTRASALSRMLGTA